ncbi:MAG: hypothetical protein P8X46_10100 [Nitrospirales bacterium]
MVNVRSDQGRGVSMRGAGLGTDPSPALVQGGVDWTRMTEAREGYALCIWFFPWRKEDLVVVTLL